MKETIRTWLAGIDDSPDIVFEDMSDIRRTRFESGEEYLNKFGEIKEREIALNEYWIEFFRKQKVEIKDIVDKKQVGLYGRSFKKLNAIDGQPTLEILDPQDVLIDRYADPSDIDTAQFVFHIHIYRTLKSLEMNKNYDQEVVRQLKTFYATEQGLIKASENYRAAVERAEKLEKMGVPDIESPVLGETYVELNECYRKLQNEKENRQEIYLIGKVDEYILMKKPLEEAIGKTKDNYWRDHYPISTWADDVERTDIWSDALADTIRQICKVLNSWFSQLIENRTLRNFGMNYYDATEPKFIPQTFEPIPWGWYPIPGDPNKIIRRVDIPELKEGLPEMMYLTGIAERATAITAQEKGVSEKKQITLGEVKILAAKTQEKAIATAKFYRESWKDFCYRWSKFIEGQADNLEPIKLSKKSLAGKLYSRIIKPKNLVSEVNYQIKVFFSAEQEAKTLEDIQKMTAVSGQMPDNVPLRKIFQKKLLNMINLNPEDIKEILDFEEQKIKTLPTPTSPGVALPEAAIPSGVAV
ncbi:hypothetical protein COW64_02025 [bacterium (Candidatus Blackallbacteria) CG18_big_fil_WC_8_21_14_2_50_49_26]|nr:MAG: hypothetical protein COW64_02025 [bacterium (Candidatus Blackallbacteria) CG18_big_fil_WC_8_21_14_2_50_49_26]